MPRKKGRMWLGCRAAGLQGLLIDLGVHGHPLALWGRPGQRSLGLKHRVAVPCFARSQVQSLPGSLLPGRVMGGSVWSSEGGVCPSPEPLPPPHSHQERTWDEEPGRVKKPSLSGYAGRSCGGESGSQGGGAWRRGGAQRTGPAVMTQPGFRL